MSILRSAPTDPPPAPLGASRESVLTELRRAGAPATVAEISAATGLHANTVRFHLDGLVEMGRADRQVEQRTRRGRPRVLFTARAEKPGARSYHLLASMLAGLVERLDTDGSAVVEAGRAWGRELTGGSSGLTDEASLRLLEELMERVGFQPEITGEQLRLHHCPFLEVAEERSEVVCALHRGLIEGALSDGPLRLTELEPFVDGSSCAAGLTR